MEKNAFSEEVMEVKNTPSQLNSFIEKNTGYIKYCAYKCVGRFITESDDEYSIALSAFLEAIDSYDISKGAFSSFANLVIKRRILDHMRKAKHHECELSVEPYLFEGEIDEDKESPISFELKEKSADISYLRQNSIDHQVTVKNEIAEISSKLTDYGFSFMDLTKCSPCTEKTKRACAKAVKAMLTSEELLQKMKRSKTLPMKELEEKSRISRKMLDRYRRYIITATLIINGDYPQLSEYMWFITNSPSNL